MKSGSDREVTPENLFNAGSVAKPVSASALLALVEDRILDLDEDVNEKLVSWQVPENVNAEEKKVTLRGLLSHSAGIKDGLTSGSSSDPPPSYLSTAGLAPTTPIQQLLDAEPGLGIDTAVYVATVPGSVYDYANAGYAIVELLAVDATGKAFDEIMSELVLEPLGMTSSTYEQPLPEKLRSRAAVEHDYLGQPIEGDRLHYPSKAAGSLWTTPSDLARFAIEISQAYMGQSDKIISQGMAGEMLSHQIETPDEPLGDFFGLGFRITGEGEDLAILHTGGTWGSNSLLWMFPEIGQGAVIMTNSASGQGVIRFEILLSIAAAYGWPVDFDS